MCFLHSIVQERRKFGPLGWCIPFEYNDGDFYASLSFLERHIEGTGGYSWSTIQYMISEVQYGGKITDDYDRRLFITYSEAWFSQNLFSPTFTYNSDSSGPHHTTQSTKFQYTNPQCLEIEEYLSYIASFPSSDDPDVFGLHQNADLTSRLIFKRFS